MPISHSITIRVKVIPVVINGLPAGFVIRRFRVCIPPSVVVMVPAWLVFRLIYYKPIRPTVSIDSRCIKHIALLAYSPTIGDNLAPGAGISLDGIHFCCGYFGYNAGVVNPLTVPEENLVAGLRVALEVLSMIFVILSRRRRVSTESAADKLLCIYLAKSLAEQTNRTL